MPDASILPVLYFDHPLPDLHRDLVDGRAVACGPDPAALAGDGPAGGVDGIIAGAAKPWDADAFAAARRGGSQRLRVISRTGVGYDNIDVAAAAAAGVVVCNAPQAPTVSTAEHTIALLCAITKRFPAQTARAVQGLGGEPVARSLELDGALLGLIGFGRIARRVATAALGLGMRVVAADPFVTDLPAGVQGAGLADVFASADVVSLHAPANAETRHLVDAARLASMRAGAYLVNCARGSLVDHDALLAALERGHLAGAALDVTDPEPLPAGHALLQRDDVIVTPHVASSTAAGRRRLYEHAIDNALAVLAGRPASVVTVPPD